MESVKDTKRKEIPISHLDIRKDRKDVAYVKYSSNGYTYGYFGGQTEYRQNYYYPQAGRNYMMMLALRF